MLKQWVVPSVEKSSSCLVLWAAGGTLAEFIQKRCNSLLEEETILHFFVQILLALHHVHTHLILHRDLKTQNILLDKHRMIVKIGDFGISKILSSKSKAYTVPGCGGTLRLTLHSCLFLFPYVGLREKAPWPALRSYPLFLSSQGCNTDFPPAGGGHSMLHLPRAV